MGISPETTGLSRTEIADEIITWFELRAEAGKPPYESKIAARGLKRRLNLTENTVEEVQASLDLLTTGKNNVINKRNKSTNMRIYSLA